MAKSWSEMSILYQSHFILTCILMVGLVTLIILLDYYKMQKKKVLIGTIAGILVAIGFGMLGLKIAETTDLLETIADYGSHYTIIIISVLTGAIGLISLLTIIIMESMRTLNKKKALYSVLFSAIVLMGLLLMTAVVIITFVLPGPADNLHLGVIIGFPALFLLSVGTILVIFNEPKFVIYHGLIAGGAWILTTLNVLLLFAMSETEMTSFSGIIHTFHILCGAIGLISGFFSALFGISGQRKLAKLTGYITLGCWWTAYMVATFISGI